jgi:NAD(P)-dependent dehydrogenase (short-subunit alcohol dehydrogenase family)
MESSFVSGVGSGIGLNIAKQLLAQGNRVYGLSRRPPAELVGHPQFRFCAVDFSNTAVARSTLSNFIADEKIARLSKVFLNVGQFGKRIAPMDKLSVDELEELMRVNVWSHKVLLDCLLVNKVGIEYAVFSSSIAGVRARAGNSGYALTKAALNMMAKLYALENPSTRFLVLGLCNVDTFLSQTIGTLPLEGDFPDIVKLRERAQGVGYLVSAEKRACDMLGLFGSDLLDRIPNGDFVEIRSLLPASV